MDDELSKYCTIVEVAKAAGIAPSTVLRWYKYPVYLDTVPDGTTPYYRRGAGKTAKVYLHPDLAKSIVDSYSAPWRMHRKNEKGDNR